VARALEAHGARVFSSDVRPHASLDTLFDFLSPGFPAALGRCDGTVTNPPWGVRNRTAVAFIKAGLHRMAAAGGFLALLLPIDFDSAVTRLPLFRHPFFVGRVILTDRPVWFGRTDGVREAPKENCCWALWARPVLRTPAPPIVHYAVAHAPRKEWRSTCNAHDDIQQSTPEVFCALRQRKAAGGPGWIVGGDVSPIEGGAR
jgi:hypothetical protein